MVSWQADPEFQPQAQSPQEKKQEELLSSAMPDAQWLRRVIRRHWGASLLVGLFVLVASLPLSLLVKNTYQSSITAQSNRRDTTRSNPTFDNGRDDPVLVSFKNRMVSVDFVGKVAQNMGLLNPENAKLGTVAQIKKALGLTSPPAGLPPEKEKERQIAIIEALRKRFSFESVNFEGSMTIVAQGPTPEEANELATALMETFVQAELKGMLGKIANDMEFYQPKLQKAKEDFVALQKKHGKADATVAQVSKDLGSAPAALSAGEISALNARLMNLESDMNRRINDKSIVKQRLQNDYQTLLARYSSSHPLVLQKKSEIEAVETGSDPSTVQAQNEIQSIRKQLADAGQAAAIPGGNLAGFSMPRGLSEEERLAFEEVVTIAKRLEELQVEQRHIQAQVTDQNQRTLIKVIRPASLDPKPIKDSRKLMLFVGFGAALAMGLGTLVLQELRSPLARDGWRLVRATQLPVLAEIRNSTLRSWPRVSKDVVVKLQEALSSGKKDISEEKKTLLNYRELELALQKSATGKVTLFINAGKTDRLGRFYFNFINVCAEDTCGRVFVVDCNPNDSLIPRNNLETKEGLADALIRRRDHGESIKITKFMDVGFEYMPPDDALDAERSKVLQSEALPKLMTRMEDKYDRIFLRSFPELNLLENMSLLKCCSDAYLVVDANRTRYADIRQLLEFVPKEKVKGIVLVGT